MSDSLADSSWVAANGERFARILSDSDQNQVEISYNEAKQRIEAHINPPGEQLKIIEAAEENRRRMGQVNRLAMWAVHSREKGGIEEGLTLEEAIELADQVMAEPPEDADDGGFGLAQKMTSFAIVGAAAIVVARADMAFLDARLEWARERLEAGCQNRRSPAEEHFTVDEARPFKVVAVALANKMARIIWALLTKGGTYRNTGAASGAARA